MKFHRALIWITGVFIAVCAAESQAGGPIPTCTLQIEVNALRAGSPTVTAGELETRDVTAKARILKGTAVSGTTIDTTLQIEVVDGSEVLHTRTKSPIRLVVGKGGRGDKLRMNIPQCTSGFITFIATFFGNDTNGALCSGTKTLRKQCAGVSTATPTATPTVTPTPSPTATPTATPGG